MERFSLFLLLALMTCVVQLTASADISSPRNTPENILEHTSENIDLLKYDAPAKFALEGPPPVVFSTPKCPSTDPMSYTVMFPNPANCSLFYMCSNGVPYSMSCPAGLHFNPALNVCDWPYNVNCREGCAGLGDDPNGKWTPASCSADTNQFGTTCTLQCGQGYILRGSAFIQCAPGGWNSSNGNQIPECVPTECIGEDLGNELNNTLSVPASLLFVLDESGSVVLITDGESQTDGTPAANQIKAAGHPIFAIGIGKALAHLESLSSQGANGIKHFFHLQDYSLLQSIGQYLNPPAGSGGSGSSSVLEVVKWKCLMQPSTSVYKKIIKLFHVI
ncbi:hypothetical protein C0J52_16956 [Blattella germanica]|nr:hypothetical protein C0J52_16956 [Blattella germanica]